MSWKVMPAAEACDLMDFWVAAPWPLSQEEVQRLGVERFGWTVEVDNGKSYLFNRVSDFTIPDVMTIAYKDVVNYLTLRLSDTIKPATPESTAFLNDAFTLMVREGESRWGTATLRDIEGTTAARWDVTGGARIQFSFRPAGITAKFETPQGVAVERKAGGR